MRTERAGAVVLLIILVVGLVAPSALGGGRTCRGRSVTHAGTAGSDSVQGTSGDDVVWTGDGDDEIRTGGGNDVVCSGPGADDVNGGLGDDVLVAGDGRDRVVAGLGYDKVFGGDGGDVLFGGDQSDVVNGNAGPDRIDMGDARTARGPSDDGFGGLGADTLKTYGSTYQRPVQLYGNKGDDTLLGTNKDHHLDGGQGRDICSRNTTRFNCERFPQ